MLQVAACAPPRMWRFFAAAAWLLLLLPACHCSDAPAVSADRWARLGQTWQLPAAALAHRHVGAMRRSMVFSQPRASFGAVLLLLLGPLASRAQTYTPPAVVLGSAVTGTLAYSTTTGYCCCCSSVTKTLTYTFSVSSDQTGRAFTVAVTYSGNYITNVGCGIGGSCSPEYGGWESAAPLGTGFTSAQTGWATYTAASNSFVSNGSAPFTLYLACAASTGLQVNSVGSRTNFGSLLTLHHPTACPSAASAPAAMTPGTSLVVDSSMTSSAISKTLVTYSGSTIGSTAAAGVLASNSGQSNYVVLNKTLSPSTA